jgi:ribosomal-protein-alanine N-acetyltransferase
MINDKYFNEFPNLESERLRLRKIDLSDASELQKIRSHAEVMKYMDSENHKNIQFSENFISENLKTYKARNGIFWALIEKSSNTFIGDFAYWKIDQKNARAEIGYTLHPKFWGKGYMKEAVKTLILFGFNDLNLHSIEANINPENDNSRKLLLKLGFVKEAYFRENYYFNGRYFDSEIYSLLQKNFKS